MTDSAITLVSRDVTGTSVDENCPYAACGTWLQVYKYIYKDDQVFILPFCMTFVVFENILKLKDDEQRSLKFLFLLRNGHMRRTVLLCSKQLS